MSALLVSEVSTRRDYWRNTAVTPTKIQSSWRRIFVDRSYHIGPFLVGWSATLPQSDKGRVARHPPAICSRLQEGDSNFPQEHLSPALGTRCLAVARLRREFIASKDAP